MSNIDPQCMKGDHEWLRTDVRDQYGVRDERFECKWCGAVRFRTGSAPSLGDRHYRED